MKYTIISLLILLLLICALGMINHAEAASVTQTYTVAGVIGYRGRSEYGSTWSAVRTASTANEQVNYVRATYIYNVMYGDSYFCGRAFFYFNLSSILVSGATVESATLIVTCTDKLGSDSVVVVSGAPSRPQIPFSDADYYYGYYGTALGMADGFTVNQNKTIQLSSPSSFLDGGIFKGCIRHYMDYADITPTSGNYVVFSNVYLQVTVKITATNIIRLNGEYNEVNGTLTGGTVQAQIYYSTLPMQTVYVNASTSPVQITNNHSIQFMRFIFSNGAVREYWLEGYAGALNLTLFRPAASSRVIVNFFDSAGILKTYPFITIQKYINGTLYELERPKVDLYNTIITNLNLYDVYIFNFGDANYMYTLGNVAVTGTAIQLTIRAVDIPADVQAVQQYIQIYGFRNGTTLTVNYRDPSNQTVLAILKLYVNGSLAATRSFTAQSWAYTYTGSANDTWYVTVDVNHARYASFTWRQYYLPAGAAQSPWSLSWLGTWPLQSEYILGSVLVLCVCGAFSKANATLGAFLMVVAAVLLTALGWLPPAPGLLVAAFSFVLLYALMKKREGEVI